ncbi:vWA domain-containing protein [Lentibacillus salicampi]|uniref:VWA domain-containing protein n=1 Tax=Lentibacillus salicampi TaxID=175306 RepID=A0A4Y9A9C5_9BACI|nr:VWA domain-containing protein [Lentibacillus salicampi]TFJ92413.1 VWA domain-containing protein [Lentibacillus salicampi]
MGKTWRWSITVLFFLLAMIISACASSEGQESSTENGQGDEQNEESAENEEGEAADAAEQEKTDESSTSEESLSFADIPDPPTDLDGLIDYPAGPFAGIAYEDQEKDIQEALAELPKLTGEPSNEEIESYWAKLLSLFAEDFPDPENVVKKWRTLSFGSPEADNPKLQFKENYNVEIILDASGSMAAYAGSKSRMAIAKESITEFASGLPEDANVGLRAYGFEGSGADSDKELSCASNELVYDIQPYEKDSLDQAMEKFQPAGWTPLADAINLAIEDLKEYDGEYNTNIIYVVSDGIETCDGDPVTAAEELADSDITPLVNVIGLDVDSEGQKQLKDIADVSDGTYTLVKNQDQLMDEFERTQNMASEWRQWKADAVSDVRQISVDRMQMIRDFRGEWADGWQREYTTFSEVFDYLESNDTISREVKTALYDLRDERIDMTTDYQDQIFDDLYELKEKQIDKAREEIEDKYNQQTDS